MWRASPPSGTTAWRQDGGKRQRSGRGGYGLAFGYAYPAYKCYKTIEKNKVDIKELRIIIAVVTVIESFIDLLISWFPMYREIKLALFICLWHPSLQGTGFVYNTLLQPYVSRYETDIDRGLLEVKQRAWDLVSDYWRYSAEVGSKKAAQLFHLLLSQSARVAAPIPPADQVLQT
ncbi:HVA22-like protein j [Sesamum indicum]|uniref:HVA22-like protein n=1 Tax=Sesamum indicum TaxID=4182 RepID=A0A8M8UZX4_SESIN|nr:HVA22-like protein j [Sesamum indicum]